MGYTHYWFTLRDIAPETWAKITDDAKKLIKASKLKLTADDQAPKPIVDEDHIWLNGKGDDEYESFILERKRDSAFCKTAKKPYDLVVCAILIVAEHHAIEVFECHSDGGMYGTVDDYAGPHDKEWDDALAFVNKTLNVNYALPFLITTRGKPRFAS